MAEALDILNKEFAVIFANSNDSVEATKFLKYHVRQSLIWRAIQILIMIGLCAVVIFLSVYYIPILNWNSSAIGRLALIKIILPFYNWQYLYDSRCLIEKETEKTTMEINEYEKYVEFHDEGCAVCESLGKISKTLFINV